MLKGPMLPLLGPLLTGLLAVLNTSLFTDITRQIWNEEYDYIIVGAGSSGSTLAARLTEDPNVSVLLLEAGGSNGGLLSEIPFTSGQLQKSDVDWAYRTVPQKNACRGLKEQRSAWPRGKVLGGSSTINYMFYSRGNRNDYDRWAEEGCTGWSWNDVFPYFLKMEDQRDPAYLSSGYHATGGPLTVESIDVQSPLSNAFLDSGRYLGYEIGDFNGPRQSWYYPQATTRDRKRCSVVKAYLQPAAGRSNLDIVTRALVTKILFEQSGRGRQPEAVGVEFRREHDTYEVRARKEVIVSAGSINSPQLLMLSGIGPAKHLRKFNIPLVANLPVGDNLHEQLWSPLSYEVPRRPATFSADNILSRANLIDFLVYDKGQLTSLGGVEVFGYAQTSYANRTLDWPDVEIIFSAQSVAGGLAKSQDLTDEFYDRFLKPYERKHTIGLHPIILRPKSRGTLRLQSTDPSVQPLLDPRFYSHPDDINSMVEALKISLRVAEAPPLRRYGIRLFAWNVPGCEQLEPNSDAFLECYARTYTAAFWHPVGTCRMGALGDKRTVVDPELRVKGVGRLRVVDASVMPYVISGHTNAPSIMIGEKAADMIRGISSVAL